MVITTYIVNLIASPHENVLLHRSKLKPSALKLETTQALEICAWADCEKIAAANCSSEFLIFESSSDC